MGFAQGLQSADATGPQAVNQRSKEFFRPGIGPHTEAKAVEMAVNASWGVGAAGACQYALAVPYPAFPRQRCDLCFGHSPGWEWAIEVKMLRVLGDNGSPNDNIFMHIFSPYPAHRSALTDCGKLRRGGFDCRLAMLIFAYESEEWPSELAITAFETLARSEHALGPRHSSKFTGLIHPVHSRGVVHAWELVTTAV